VTDWAMVAQARDGIKRLIDESPETVAIARAALVDNGFGDLVADPTGTTTDVVVRCRLSHEASGPAALTMAPAGLSSNLRRYILVDHSTTIFEGEAFEAIGRGWKIGAVDPLKKFGQVIGYQAPLVEASTVGVTT
jgi:hypothetical protein